MVKFNCEKCGDIPPSQVLVRDTVRGTIDRHWVGQDDPALFVDEDCLQQLTDVEGGDDLDFINTEMLHSPNECGATVTMIVDEETL